MGHVTACPLVLVGTMWDYCGHSLETARLRGARYADVRVMQMRQRDLTTKNGQVGTLGQSESIGLGIQIGRAHV